MEAGVLIWVVVCAGGALALAAATMSYLSLSATRELRRVADGRWRNVDARLNGVESTTAAIVKSLPTGPALVATFTATGPPSSESVEPMYPTPPDGPRSTMMPLARKR